MELNGLSAPVLGVEERSDEVPSMGASSSRWVPPDPEVVAKPKRRRFTAEYRLRIVEEADACTESGNVGRLLRREGLYSSHLTKWREACRDGALRGLRSKKRGAKPKAINPLVPKVRELEAKVARLEKDLHTAHTILDVQRYREAPSFLLSEAWVAVRRRHGPMMLIRKVARCRFEQQNPGAL